MMTLNQETRVEMKPPSPTDEPSHHVGYHGRSPGKPVGSGLLGAQW